MKPTPGILEWTTIFFVTPRTRVSSMRTCESSVTRCSIFASGTLEAGAAVSTSGGCAASAAGAEAAAGGQEPYYRRVREATLGLDPRR